MPTLLPASQGEPGPGPGKEAARNPIGDLEVADRPDQLRDPSRSDAVPHKNKQLNGFRRNRQHQNLQADRPVRPDELGQERGKRETPSEHLFTPSQMR